MGERTRDLLLEHAPLDPHVGVFHGDFQTGNILFDGAEVVALVDWEISGIGAQLIDIGWLLFMNDRESWFDAGGLENVPPFEDIVAWYSAAVGRPVALDGRRLLPRPVRLPLRRDQRPQRDAPPHRQAPRPRVGADRAVGAGDVRAGLCPARGLTRPPTRRRPAPRIRRFVRGPVRVAPLGPWRHGERATPTAYGRSAEPVTAQ